MTDVGTLLTAMLAGLGGAAHCAAMCGPLTLALGAPAMTAGSSAISTAVRFNVGRISAYTLAGTVTAGLIGSTIDAAHLQLVSEALRWVAAAMLALVAMGLLGLPGLSRLEQASAPLWQALRRLAGPLTRAAMQAPPYWRPVLFGGLWLFMPCGLVYAMLLVAATRESALAGGLVMLAFGVGTTPAVMSLSVAGTRLVQWLQQRGTRRVLGLLLLLAALAGSVLATGHGPHGGDAVHAHHHHGSG